MSRRRAQAPALSFLHGEWARVHLVAVFGTFVFLVWTTFRNRLYQRIRRLRHPRYLLGTLAVVLYIGAFFLVPYHNTVPAHGTNTSMPAGDLPIRIVSVGLLLFVARWWLFEKDPVVLAFAPAEVQYLFPAPLRRRDLLSYKLVTAQIQLFVSALVISLVAVRLDRSMPAGLRLIAAWVFLVTLYLHHLGASLIRVGVMQATPGRRRPLLAAAVAAIVGVILVIGVVTAWPPNLDSASLRGVLDASGTVLRSPLVGAVLWPFRVALAPLFASSPSTWAHALLLAIPLLAVHYVWVLRIDVRFEEAAAEASATLANRIRAMRQRMTGGPAIETTPGQAGRRRHAWFSLRSTGEPAIAIVWKNMVALQRRGWRTVWTSGLLVFGCVVFLLASPHSAKASNAVALAPALAFLAWMLAFFRPAAFQNDLSGDVAYLALLRTYPLSGVRIMAASIASAVIPLVLVQLTLVAAACVICPSELPGLTMTVPARVAVFVASAIALPPLDTTSATIGNAIALLFPGARGLGTRVGGAGAPGAGQYLVSRLAAILAAILAFVAPTGVGVLANLLGRQFASPPAAMLGAAAAFILAYLAQLSILIRWAGRVFDRTDAVSVSAVD
jgi:ABC-2 type transport system permease protein